MSLCSYCGSDPSKRNRSLPYGTNGVYFCSFFCMKAYERKQEKEGNK